MIQPTIKVEDEVDAYIESIEEIREPDGMWHPSSMWRCDRAAVLGVWGEPPTNPIEKETKRIFRIGHIIHGVVQAALAASKNLLGFEAEVPVEVPEWNVAGHADGVLQEANGDEWLLEVKSIKTLRFTPKEDDEKQAATYVEGLIKMGRTIAGIILVYLKKSDGEIKEYVIPRKGTWLPMVEKKIAQLEEYKEGVSLPPPLPLDKGKPHWYTNYCPYRGSGKCCGD